ncbi:MAG: hypothetical protein A3F25_01580 [Candidatus Yanofskybacteria bacterium RIFCSPHIGHO2_12_FULL_45_19b]|uniref:Uncharacterized protein n=1 Tax=Candidatus Yanofskybacteria bacterium RIFCSPHIGHO2_12_FULL_45_19b TaxID=1802689 RepID=A0A1F8G5H0_9BACT|nr:MAG: hypothetical protein A3F25_01580 [Candidatus Yanofskybacteria bacterium RIFCSPHIGHO2_12_FULL_45_19b]
MIDKILADKKNLMIVLLGLLCLMLGYLTFFPPKKTTSVGLNPEQQKVQDKIKENVLKTFPKELLLDSAAKEVYSNAQSTSEGLRLDKLYISQQAPDKLSQLYIKTLTAAGWTQLDKVQPSAGGTVVAFTKQYSRVSVSVSQDKAGTKLGIAYYARLAIFDDPLRMP